jgi:hypothetical protein
VPTELETVVVPEESPFKLSILVSRYYILQEWFSWRAQSYSSKAKLQLSDEKAIFLEL